MDGLEGKISGMQDKFNGRFVALEGNVQGLEEKMDGQFFAVHSEIRMLDGKIDALERRVDVSDRLLLWMERYASSKRGTSLRRQSSSGCS